MQSPIEAQSANAAAVNPAAAFERINSVTKGAKRLEFGDALRGWAVIMVVLHHSSARVVELHPQLATLTFGGARGVQLFYVLSAYMLARSMATRYAVERRPIAAFLLRRIFRIVPLYWIAIALHLWVYGIKSRAMLGDHPTIGWPHILGNVFLLHGFYPYWINSVVMGGWSVAVEFMFYALMPLLWTYIRNWRNALFAVALALVLCPLQYSFLLSRPMISHETLWGYFLFFSLPTQLPSFLIGLLLYWVLESIRERSCSVSPQLIRWLPWGSLPVALCTAWLPVNVPIQTYIAATGWFGVSLGLALKPAPFLVNRLVSRIGVVSYSVYLLHPVVMGVTWGAQYRFLKTIGWNAPDWVVQLGWVVMPLVSAVLVSIFTQRWIEDPGIRLGNALIRRWNLDGKDGTGTKQNPAG